MNGYDLWSEASAQPEAEAAAGRLQKAAVGLQGLWPFLSLAQSASEHEQRMGLAAGRIEAIAAGAGVAPGEVEDMARRFFALAVASRHTAAEEDDGQVMIVDKRTGAEVAGPMSAEEAHEKIESSDFGVPREELAIERVSEGDERTEGEGDEGEEGSSEKEASLRREALLRRQASALRAHMSIAHTADRQPPPGVSDDILRWVHSNLQCPGWQRWGGLRPVTALPEGEDPLGWLEGFNGGQGGPERPDGHATQYSGDGSYSEIPMGPESGPDPAVTGWIDPQRQNNGPGDQGQVSPADHMARRRTGRLAAAETPERSGDRPQPNAGGAQPVPPAGRMSGSPEGGGGSARPAGRSSESPEGNDGNGQQPFDPMARQVPLTTRPHQGPGGGPAEPAQPEPTSVVGIPVPMPAQPGMPPEQPGAGGQAPGSPDQTITAAARLIQRHNPQLSPRECRRIGARMAARHFTALSSVYDDTPDPSQTGGGSSHFIPRPGGAGEAAGGAEEAAEVLPELAL